MSGFKKYVNPFFFRKNRHMEVIEKVREVAQGYLKEHDIEIVDITFRREQQGLVLRVLADNPRGITVNECEGLNSYLSEALDKEDVIRDRYILEVASPGLDRPIKTDRDFEHSLGKVLEITTYEAIDGRK